LRKASAFRSRRRAASKSSRLADMLVVGLRQIITGGLRPAVVLLSHSSKHIVMCAKEAGKYEVWRSVMVILDLLVELQMSVTISIIEGVDLGRGFTQGLMRTVEREQGGLC
jgi:hypothetical protein